MRSSIVISTLFTVLSACLQEESKETVRPAGVQPSNFAQTRMANCRLRWDVRLENPLRDETVYERPKPLDDLTNTTPGKFQVIAYPEEAALVDETYRGMKVRVVNASGTPIAVPTIDFWLYLIQEARDSNGNWRPIESRDSPFCTYSNFSFELPAHRYWEFGVPKYEGAIETDLRFALGLGGDEWIYSKAFRGSINPEQFASKFSSEMQKDKPVSYFQMPANDVE